MINFYKATTDAKNQGLYKMYIYDKITTMFSDYTKFLLEVGDKNYNEFKDFTATLLLKMELKKHIIFYKYSIEGYSSIPSN